MAELFGFSIKRSSKEESGPNERTFVSPPLDDGAVEVAGGGFFGQVLDTNGREKNDIDLIRRYRDISQQTECDSAIEDIVNEGIVANQEDVPVQISLDRVPFSDKIKRKIRKEFEEVLRLLDFGVKGHDIFRRWYVDGRIYYHKLIDLKKPHEGIQELRYIDAMKMRYVRKAKQDEKDKYRGPRRLNSDDPMEYEFPEIEEFFIYNPKLTYPTGNINAAGPNSGIKMTKDSIAYATSGLVDRNKGSTLSYLHKAIKSLNQLRMIEDSLVIYRLSRAPERRIFYIDVGNLPKVKAEAYLRDVMMRYRNKLVYDAGTGEIRDDKKYMSMLEDFWLPRREGGRGTEISTLPGGQNLGEITDIEYFKKKLYRSLNVPPSRMDGEGGFNLGRSSEILRDEVKFSKFVGRLRKRFSGLFIDMLRTQLLLKNIVTPEDWEIMSEHIQFDFLYDNHFTELKETELMNERLASLATVEPYIGKYYSQDWVRRKVLRQTDEEILEQDKLIKKEIKDGIIPDPAAIEQDMMLDPEGSGGLRPVDPTQLGATQAEPDAALRSMNVDTTAATQDANIVKPKGGEI